jgi:hypothetical protein
VSAYTATHGHYCIRRNLCVSPLCVIMFKLSNIPSGYCEGTVW